MELNKGTYRVLDWDANNIKLDGGIGWISKDELDEDEVYESSQDGCIGRITISNKIYPSYDMTPPIDIQETTNSNQTWGQQTTVFEQGEVVQYQSIQYDKKGIKYYTVQDELGSTCFIPENYVGLDQSFVGEKLNGYTFDEVPLFPTCVALSLNDPLLEEYSGYIVRANANKYSKGSVLSVTVENNQNLNRYLYVVDDDFQGIEDMGILFSSELDKQYWGKRNIKTLVVEKGLTLEDFRDHYMFKNEEVIDFG